jgi:hypothetical protein
MRKALGRAAAAALVGAGLLLPTPAHASGTLSVTVNCEALSRQRVSCLRTVSGGTLPLTTKWYYNGTYVPSQDNHSTAQFSCSLTQSNTYQAVVTDALGATGSGSAMVGCLSGG